MRGWARARSNASGAVIATKRLQLRSWDDDDGADLAVLLANPQATADLGGPVSRADSDRKLARFRQVFEREGICKWRLSCEGAFIGYCGIMPVEPSHPLGAHHEIGWRLLPQFWGHGLAAEAAGAALGHAFDHIGLAQVMAYTAPDNRRSRAVMERIGMRREAALDFTMFYQELGYWTGLVWVADRAAR